jgi:hypothetical protein
MPKYKIYSSDTGRTFYSEASFEQLMRIIEIPESEHLALYTAEIGTICKFYLKPAHTGFDLFVEKVSD